MGSAHRPCWMCVLCSPAWAKAKVPETAGFPTRAGVKPVTTELIQLFFYPANPLGILVANLLSPALVKKAEDIPMMVRGS